MPSPERTASIEHDLDERELVERIRAGDIAAFEIVFWRYYESLSRFALTYVGSPDVAEDLVQDVFIRVWEGRKRLEMRNELKKYLFGATRNRALDVLRHQAVVRRTHESTAPDVQTMLRLMQEPEPSDAALERAELDATIRRAIDRLPARCRQTFLLSREQGISYAEVAQVMGVSVKTVKIQIGRALKAIRAAIGPVLLAIALGIIR